MQPDGHRPPRATHGLSNLRGLELLPIAQQQRFPIILGSRRSAPANPSSISSGPGVSSARLAAQPLAQALCVWPPPTTLVCKRLPGNPYSHGSASSGTAERASARPP